MERLTNNVIFHIASTLLLKKIDNDSNKLRLINLLNFIVDNTFF